MIISLSESDDEIIFLRLVCEFMPFTFTTPFTSFYILLPNEQVRQFFLASQSDFDFWYGACGVSEVIRRYIWLLANIKPSTFAFSACSELCDRASHQANDFIFRKSTELYFHRWCCNIFSIKSFIGAGNGCIVFSFEILNCLYS